MIICICANISDKQIKQCNSFEDAQIDLGVCLKCMKCVHEVNTLVINNHEDKIMNGLQLTVWNIHDDIKTISDAAFYLEAIYDDRFDVTMDPKEQRDHALKTIGDNCSLNGFDVQDVYNLLIPEIRSYFGV